MALATGLGGTLFADAPDASAYGSPETAEPYWFALAELVVSDVNDQKENWICVRTSHPRSPGAMSKADELMGAPSRKVASTVSLAC